MDLEKVVTGTDGQSYNADDYQPGQTVDVEYCGTFAEVTATYICELRDNSQRYWRLFGTTKHSDSR